MEEEEEESLWHQEWTWKNRKLVLARWAHHTSVEPNVLHGGEGVPARGYRHSGRHLSAVAVQRVGASPVALRTLDGFGRPRRRRARGLGVGGRQGIVVLVKCPWDLVKGARRRREIVVVGGSLVALHGGEGVAGRLEGVHLLVVHVGVARGAQRRRLGTETLRKDIAGFLWGVVVHWQVVLARLGETVETMQLGAHAVQAVGEAVGELLRRGVAPNKHAVPCGLGETGTPATEKHTRSLKF